MIGVGNPPQPSAWHLPMGQSYSNPRIPGVLNRLYLDLLRPESLFRKRHARILFGGPLTKEKSVVYCP
jgi:hypothetical protein